MEENSPSIGHQNQAVFELFSGLLRVPKTWGGKGFRGGTSKLTRQRSALSPLCPRGYRSKAFGKLLCGENESILQSEMCSFALRPKSGDKRAAVQTHALLMPAARSAPRLSQELKRLRDCPEQCFLQPCSSISMHNKQRAFSLKFLILSNRVVLLSFKIGIMSRNQTLDEASRLAVSRPYSSMYLLSIANGPTATSTIGRKYAALTPNGCHCISTSPYSLSERLRDLALIVALV